MTPAAGESIAVPIAEASQAGDARRRAVALAGGLGFDETDRGRVALVVTEAATNLLKHAGGGELALRGLEDGSRAGLEVLALDRGPGMADVGRCLTDGFSTAGSPGAGLGAIGRLANLFDLHSLPGVGTGLLAHLWPGAAGAAPDGAGLDLGAVCLPLAGEEVCGDAWAVVEDEPGRGLLLVVDGLGHGPAAAAAALTAVRIFREQAACAPAEIVHKAHAALRSTRGAALAVAALDRPGRRVLFAGVGNIAGTILPPGGARGASMVSHNGTVGHELRKVQEFVYAWPDDALVVLHSDGLTAHWRLDRYPGLTPCHPALIAGILYRDFKRGRDDVTVLAVRERKPSPA